MEPQEHDLITTLLTRLQDASKSGQQKEPEADAMIRQAMAQMPDAPYYLVQTVLIQDLSLQNAQGRIAELEKQVANLSAPQKPPTSFLGGLFGRSSAPAPASVPPSGPWTRGPQAVPPPRQGYVPPQYAQQGFARQPGGYAQQPGPQQQPGSGMFGGGGGGGGSGFLRSAAATAAGVAGGALLFQGISSLFGHGYANSLGGGLGGAPGGLSETVSNNYYGDQGSGDYGGGGDFSGAGDDYGGGGDFSGGGDYAGDGDYGGAGDYGSGDDYGGGSDFGGGSDNFSC
jgi:hypothetical protein